MRRFLLPASMLAIVCPPASLWAEPPASLAPLKAAHRLVRQGKLNEAAAAFNTLLEMEGIPAHHRWEAEDCIREIQRLQAGQPARDPKAGRTQLPPRPAPGWTLHVAVEGADTNPGTVERPFASLERARDEIRALKQRQGLPAGGVAVLIHGGAYRMRSTLKLGQADSGTAAAPIVYRAADDHRPRFSGGIRLTDFQPVTDAALLSTWPEEARRRVMRVDLKLLGVETLPPLVLGGFASGRGFKTHPCVELFFDGKAMPLARWPNEGYERVVAVAEGGERTSPDGSRTGPIFYGGDRAARWQGEKELWLYGYWFWDWADSYERVAAIDTASRQITLAAPYHNYGYRKGQRFCAVNALCEIDAPGEWYLDRAERVLYLYPPSDPGGAVVELSTAAFPFVEFHNAAHVALEGLILEQGCADGVIITGGEHCLLAGCTLRRFAGNGVEIRGGTGHGLLSCDIHSMGRGGTTIDGGDRKTLAPGRHFIENCHIHDLSRIDHTYTPAVRMTGVGNHIAHNLMHDIRSSAINLGGNDHLVEYNEVCDFVLESDDQGGVDMWGDPTFRGNVYRYNYWHHVGNWQHPAGEPDCGRAGIRLDDAICGALIYGNVFYRCSAGRLGFGGVQIHGGKDNIIDNNIFVDCLAAISFSMWGEARWKQFIDQRLDAPQIDRTLYLARYPELARLADDHDVNHVWRNLAVRCGKFLHRGDGRTRVADNLVTADDPGFRESAKGDFQMSGSPAADSVGLRPVPFDAIGLYLDDFRRELPAARRARAAPGGE